MSTELIPSTDTAGQFARRVGGSSTTGAAGTIRPFGPIRALEADLADLRRRVAATRWPDKETVDDDTQGVQLATMRALADYWVTQYDWRKVEARMNAMPQFITEIDGVDIHFIHVRSQHEDALPLIVTHGWPGSVAEQLKIVGPLTDPTAHGGSASDAFHVVIPSIPGFGYSGKPTTTGWDPDRIARAWIVLMQRLGYDRYVAQGGDWGSLVTELMGVMAPPELLAIHVNLPQGVPPDILARAASGAPPKPDFSAEENWAYERLSFFLSKGLAYAQEMGGRPQTLFGIADSPIGLAAWFLDHDQLSYQMIRRTFEGQPEGLTRDDVLDNITLAWLTNTGVSSGRIYWENKHPFFAPMGVKIPVAVSAFPQELYQLPKDWAEQAYPQLMFYNRPPKGGHFAAWEQPGYLVADLRAAFSALR